MKKEYEEVDSYRVEGNQYCIADELLDNNVKGSEKLHTCGSSDAMSTYEAEHEDGTTTYTSYCFSCSQSFNKELFAKSSYASEFGIEDGIVTEKKKFERKPKAEPITREQIKEVLSYGYEAKGYRGLKDKYLQFFGHAVKKGRDGKPKVIFYPETKEGKLVGYKSRTLPKSFGYENKGITGIKNDLAGMVKFKDMTGRDLLIVGGELDLCSAMQMFDEYQQNKAKKFNSDNGEYLPMPIVSPTTGEGSAVKQCRDHYDFINRFDNIIIGLDADDAGKSAAKEIAGLFPKNKVKIILWTMGDPNSYLHNKEGKDLSAQFIRDFFNAKPYFQDGIKSSKSLMGDIAEVLLKKRITMPSYMEGISKMMGGNSGEFGMLQNVILNIYGDTSCGKTTHVNGMCYHWFMTSPQKPIVASLEATAGQYALDIISIHLGENIRKGRTGKEVLAYLETPEIQERLKDLWENDYGEERFQIIDEREGDIKNLQEQLELAFNRDGCELFVIDVLTDIIRSLSNEEQADHMAWQKGMVKKGATIVNVLHTKKPTKNSEGKQNRITEYDSYGSSSVIQSAAINILIDRDKMTTDDIEKNTTRVRMPKCREGDTGDAGEWFYDQDTRAVHDRDKFFRDHPDKLPAGYDLKDNPYAQEEKKSFSKRAGNGKKDSPVDTFNLEDTSGVSV